MRSFQIKLFFLLLLSSYTSFGIDIYPQIPIMHGFVRNYAEDGNAEILFPLSTSKKEKLTGFKIFREYQWKTGDHPNSMQILKFHFNTISKLGGRMMCRSDEFASFKVMINGKKLAVVVETYHDGTQYTITAMEVSDVVKDEVIPAEELFSMLDKEGHVAFYFSFESGESELATGANEEIGEIAKMMKEHPELKLMVEGHTDNVGKATDNLNLSKQRAAVVRNALITAGVNPERLIARGIGQAKPIADNETASGREKNRRVELVKIK